MASSKHTTQYQLNQWQAGDPVLREDFNSDNLKLENALAALATALATKAGNDQLSAAEQTIPKVSAGSYVGDGTASKSISLPFTPKAVYVCPSHGGTLWIPEGSGNGTTYTYGGLAVTGQNAVTWRGGHDVVAIQTGGTSGGDNSGNGTNNGGTPATGDTGVLVWAIALPVTILAAAFVLKRKEREA